MKDKGVSFKIIRIIFTKNACDLIEIMLLQIKCAVRPTLNTL